MRLIALEIPDDASDLAGWLEGHLVGLELSALVAELEAVHGQAQGHGSAQPPFSLETILGNQRDAVLAGGLVSLPPDHLRQLLRHPRLLLDLQELILISGRPYWHRRAESILEQAPASEQKAAVDRGWDWLTASVIEHPTVSVPIRAGAVHSPASVTRPRSGSRWRSLSVASLAAAAAVVLVVFAVSRWPSCDRAGNGPPGPSVASSSGWGWNRPDALPQDLPRNAYLNHLADGAQAWFKQRPDDPVALAKRITEFRQGCSVLIQSPHKPLPADDRTWLVEKCRAWMGKLDAHLAALESGQDALKVRGEADETINTLIAALRERARGIA
ncbi:MAG: hypothetical protein ACHRXM_27800 [Isosphaerales bacterium]